MLLLLGPKNADDLLPSSSIKKKGTAGASSKSLEKSAENCREVHGGEARPSTNNASASPPSPASEGDAKDETKTVNSIDELLAERGLLHEVVRNRDPQRIVGFGFAAFSFVGAHWLTAPPVPKLVLFKNARADSHAGVHST
jgi:hypothetical protein